MTETTEPRTEPPAAVATTGRSWEPSPAWERPSRLNQVAVWVGIIAGVVFSVAVVFFSGFFIGKHSGAYFGREHRGDGYGMYHGDGPMGPDDMMGPGAMMGPGQRGPMGPGQMGPGQMGPGQMGPGQMGPGQTGPMGPGQTAPTAPVSPSSPRP
jgi:hypothetical protein